MNKTLKRLIFYLFSTVIMLYLLVLIVDMIMVLLKYKIDVTGHLIISSVLDTAFHPIKFIQSTIAEKNPLVIAGSMAIIGYMSFLFFKSIQKQKSWEVDSKDTHGSSDWLTKHELTKSHDYICMSQNGFYEDWKKTLRGDKA